MLTIKANLTHTPTTLKQPDCQIEKIIELPTDEFLLLLHCPNDYYSFISENHALMYDSQGTYHCLLVLEHEGYDGILIKESDNISGRDVAFIPYARDFVKGEMERTADYLLTYTEPYEESGRIVIYPEDIDEVESDSVITQMFYRVLTGHPDVDNVTVSGNAMVVTPAVDQKQEISAGLKLRDVLLLGGMENVYMVHDTADVGFVPASYATILTDTEREEHTDLLSARVKEIRPGAYGPEIVLTDVDPELLVRFDRVAAAHEPTESMMGPTL